MVTQPSFFQMLKLTPMPQTPVHSFARTKEPNQENAPRMIA